MGTRRQLLDRISGGLAAAVGAWLLWAWGALGLGQQRRGAVRRISLARPNAEGVTASGGVLLVRDAAGVRAFSARCPHLGCRIARVESGVAICPCHGSRFDDRGRALFGPAGEGLTPLAVEERADGRLDVLLPS